MLSHNHFLLKKIDHIVEEYFRNYPESKGVGRVVAPGELEELSRKLRKRIPKWYRELLCKYPIAGIELAIPNDFGQKELIGKPAEKLPLMEIVFNEPSEIEEYGTQLFPGFQLIKSRYICFARDEFSTGEGIFFNGNETNPSTHLVFHDTGESNKELIQNSTVLTENFTDLFRFGKVSNSSRQLLEKDMGDAMKAVGYANNEISRFLHDCSSSLNEESLQKEKKLIENGISLLNEQNPIKSIQATTDTLHEFELSIPAKLYQLLIEAYNSCGLHIGELCYIENLTEKE